MKPKKKKKIDVNLQLMIQQEEQIKKEFSEPQKSKKLNSVKSASQRNAKEA